MEFSRVIRVESKRSASPKSASLGTLELEMRMLGGLISRCTTPLSCSRARARTTGAAMPTASAGSSTLRRVSRFSSDSPSTSSMAMYCSPSITPPS
jgi:hypothetical protein